MTLSALEEAILNMHEKAMSPDPSQAAGGRLGKEMVQLIDRWMSDEFERGTAPEVVLWAATEISVVMVASIASGLARNGHEWKLAQKAKEASNAMYDALIHALKEHIVRT